MATVLRPLPAFYMSFVNAVSRFDVKLDMVVFLSCGSPSFLFALNGKKISADCIGKSKVGNFTAYFNFRFFIVAAFELLTLQKTNCKPMQDED